MTSNRHHFQTRPPRRTVGVLLLLFALAVGLIAVLPSSTPVALAARLFQSPVESPPAEPTAAPENPTAAPEQPTMVPELPTQEPVQSQPTPTEVQQAPAEQPTLTLGPAPTQQQPTVAPADQTPADAQRSPEGTQEPENGKIDWVRLIDTTVLVFSWFWLACGAVVVIVVVVLLIVIFRRSRRQPK